MSNEPVVIQPRTLASIELAIAEHKVAIASLCHEGARIFADEKASGAEVLDWLVESGMTERDARQLLVEIIKERRARRDQVGS